MSIAFPFNSPRWTIVLLLSISCSGGQAGQRKTIAASSATPDSSNALPSAGSAGDAPQNNDASSGQTTSTPASADTLGGSSTGPAATTATPPATGSTTTITATPPATGSTTTITATPPATGSTATSTTSSTTGASAPTTGNGSLAAGSRFLPAGTGIGTTTGMQGLTNSGQTLQQCNSSGKAWVPQFSGSSGSAQCGENLAPITCDTADIAAYFKSVGLADHYASFTANTPGYFLYNCGLKDGMLTLHWARLQGEELEYAALGVIYL